MKPQGTLLLNRGDITSLLNLQDYLRVVEDAFRLHAEGQTLETGLLHVDAVDGEFHIKAGGLKGERTYFALKVNGGSSRTGRGSICRTSRAPSSCTTGGTATRSR